MSSSLAVSVERDRKAATERVISAAVLVVHKVINEFCGSFAEMGPFLSRQQLVGEPLLIPSTLLLPLLGIVGKVETAEMLPKECPAAPGNCEVGQSESTVASEQRQLVVERYFAVVQQIGDDHL
jgi:hypothetical protein